MGDEQMGIGDAIAKSLETEPVRNLLGPVTEQVGLLAGDVAGIVRFYTKRHLEKVFTLWAKQRHNQPLPPDTDISSLIPLIQQASLQSDEELQQRWAALLESAVTTPNGVLPSFGQTLSQLTAEEARYIDRLYAYVTNETTSAGRAIGGLTMLFALYDGRLARFAIGFREGDLQSVFAQAKLFIHDLLRLGIITLEQAPKPHHLQGTDQIALERFLAGLQNPGLVSSYSFTDYGLSFIRAVTPKPHGD
jgi:hypothetical protein